jgi:hypothetical protein
MSHKQFCVAVLICAVLFIGFALAQNNTKPLTNDDVVAMVKGGLPENTVINAINAQDSNFDVSATALIKLKQQGVNSKIMDAMLAAANKKHSAAPAPAPAAAPAAAPAPAAAAGQPSVTVLKGTTPQPIPVSKTQIAQTKTKATSLNALSTDNALGQAMQSVAMSAAQEAAYRSGSYTGASAIGAAGGVMGGLMGHRKPTVTDVWALPGQKSDLVLDSNQPSFEVHFANIPGVVADEYEPALVKLASSPNNFRLVGATQAKQDVLESSTLDWEIYSSFIEERVGAQATKVSSGEYKLQAAAALPAGEYGVVLRPLNKSKKFSGSSVAQNSGEGLLFNSVWAFAVK